MLDPEFTALTPHEKLVYIYIQAAENKDKRMWWSVGGLASATGLSESTIQRCLRSLVKRGLITRWQEDGTTYTRTEGVRLTGYPVTQTGEPSHSDSPALSHRQVDPVTVTPKGISKKRGTNTNTHKSNTDRTSINKLYDFFFLEFWGEYPRAEKKKYAAECYHKAIDEGRATHDEIMAGVRHLNWAIFEELKDPNYLQHPSTWLNNDGWADRFGEPKVITHAEKHERMVDRMIEDMRHEQLRKLQPKDRHLESVAEPNLKLVAGPTEPEVGGHAASKDHGNSRGIEQKDTRAKARHVHIPVNRMPGTAGRRS